MGILVAVNAVEVALPPLKEEEEEEEEEEKEEEEAESESAESEEWGRAAYWLGRLGGTQAWAASIASL